MFSQLSIKIILPILVGLIYFVISKRDEIISFFSFSRRELKKHLLLEENVKIKNTDLKEFIDFRIQKTLFLLQQV